MLLAKIYLTTWNLVCNSKGRMLIVGTNVGYMSVYLLNTVPLDQISDECNHSLSVLNWVKNSLLTLRNLK
jgi:hypothetical protein